MTSPTTRIPVLPTVLAPERTLRYHGAGLTHAGQVRKENEDAILTDPTGILWAIADGMGGYGQGDVASDFVTRNLAEVSDQAIATSALRASLHRANTQIQSHSQANGSTPIGATVVAMMMQNAIAHIVWAGDCRAYLYRNGSLRLLTRDHTVVQDLVDQGLLGQAEKGHHPEAHVVTRAVGYEPEVILDALSVPVVPNDVAVLCSDGLTGCLSDQEISDHIANVRAGDMANLCAGLVSACLERGAPDNVSVIAVQVQEPS